MMALSRLFCRSMLLCIIHCASIVFAQSYGLVDNYQPSTFLGMFDFYNSYDPTSGHVQYVNQTIADVLNLTTVTEDTVYLKVDTVNRYPLGGLGRPSLRLISKNNYTYGLFILDLTHMPTGCGTWPAYWLLGPNWPNNGEIDIIEGANVDTNNHVTLHTSLNCSVSGLNQTATYDRADCAYHPPSDNYGCGNTDPRTDSYGPGLNAIGGGIYATEWTSNWIRVWFWPRNGTIPTSIINGEPNPAADFGLPAVNFAGNCNFDAHFAQLQIIFNTDFCGDWAGNTYAYTTCPQTNGLSGWDSCVTFVGNNPGNFTEAYWGIKSVRVYQQPSNLSYSTVSLPVVSTTPTPLASISSVPAIDGGMGQPNFTTTPINVVIGNATINASISGSTTTYIGPNTITTTDLFTSPSALACPGSDGYSYSAGNGFVFKIECYTDRSGNDMPPPGPYFGVSTLEDCIAFCEARSGCVDISWVLDSQACYLKSGLGAPQSDGGVYGAFLAASPTPSPSTIPSLKSSSASLTSYLQTSMTTSNSRLLMSNPSQISGVASQSAPSNVASFGRLSSTSLTQTTASPTMVVVGSQITTSNNGASSVVFPVASSSTPSSFSFPSPSTDASSSSWQASSSPSSATVSTSIPARSNSELSTSSSASSGSPEWSPSHISTTAMKSGSGSISGNNNLPTSTMASENATPTVLTASAASPTMSKMPVTLKFTNATFIGPVVLDNSTGILTFSANVNDSFASVTTSVNLDVSMTYQINLYLRTILSETPVRMAKRDLRKRQDDNDTDICIFAITAQNNIVFTIPLEVLANNFTDFTSDPFVPLNSSVPLAVEEICGADTTPLDVQAADMIIFLAEDVESPTSSSSPSSFPNSGLSVASTLGSTFATIPSQSSPAISFIGSPYSTDPSNAVPSLSLVLPSSSGLEAQSGLIYSLSATNIPSLTNTASPVVLGASPTVTSQSATASNWFSSILGFPTCPKRTTTLSVTATITLCPSTCAITPMSNWEKTLSAALCTSTFGLCFDCALTPEIGWYADCTSTSTPTANANPSIFLAPSATVSFTPSSTPPYDPNVPPTCTDRILYGDPFNDAYGQSWSIYCDSEFIDMRRDITGQNTFQSSFVSCMTACDLFNLENFNQPSLCVAVSWSADFLDLDGNNCYLKASANNLIRRDGYHSAKLRTLYHGPNNTLPLFSSLLPIDNITPISTPVSTQTIRTIITTVNPPITSAYTSIIYALIPSLSQPAVPLASLSISISTETAVVTSLSQSTPLSPSISPITFTSTSTIITTQTSLSTSTTTTNNSPSFTTLTITQPVTNIQITTVVSFSTQTSGPVTFTFVTTSTRLHTFTFTPTAITITQPGTRITTTTYTSYAKYTPPASRTPTFSCRPRPTNYLNGARATTILPEPAETPLRKRSVLEYVHK